MKHIPHIYRLQSIDHLMWGVRIFNKFETPGRNEGTPIDERELGRENAAKFLKEKAQSITNGAGELIKVPLEWAIAIPNGIIKGLQETLNKKPQPKETVVGLLSSMASFFRAEPSIAEFIQGESLKAEINDFATLKNLTSHTEWVNAISKMTPDFLQNPDPFELETKKPFGPYELLQSVSPEKRQEVYFNFVNKYIPERLQAKQGWMGRTNADKLTAMGEGGMNVAGDAIQGMLGLNRDLRDRKTNPALQLAQDSLADYYHKNRPDFWDPENPDRLKRIPVKLEEDYEYALAYERIRGIKDHATNPDNIEEEIGPSRFKGALQLGVIDQKILEQMYPVVTREKDFETSNAISGANRQLNELTGSVEAMMRNETETIKDRWNGLHPGIKLLVIAGMGYGFMKNNFVKGTVLALGGVYLFQKLALGEKDPLNQWSKIVGGPFNALKNKNKNDFGQNITPGTVDDAMSRAQLYVKFLKKFDYINMEQQAVGLGVLGDMSLKTLANNFEIGGDHHEEFYLNVEGMDPLMQKAMKEHGWNADYHAFYANPENRRQSAEAMGWVFYLRAAENLENAEEVEFIEEVRRNLPPGSSLSRLPSPWANPDPMKNQRYETQADPEFDQDMRDAEEMYVRLVKEGQMASLNDGRSLNQFAGQALQIPPPINRSRGGDANRKTNEGGTAERRTNEGGDANRRINEGGNAERRTNEGGDANRRETEGGDANRRTTEGGDANRREAEGGNADRRTSEGGSAERYTTEGGSANHRTTEGGQAGRRTGMGNDSPKQSGPNGGNASAQSPDEGGEARRK